MLERGGTEHREVFRRWFLLRTLLNLLPVLAFPVGVLAAEPAWGSDAKAIAGARHLIEPTAFSSEMLIVVVVTALAVICSILFHYEALIVLTNFIRKFVRLHRTRLLVFIFSLLVVHTVEIWLFALGFYFLDGIDGVGFLQGLVQEGALDYVYFSAVTYTTLGYGDLLPVGHIRLLSAVEALTGLILIGWSSSVAFLLMQRNWGKD